MKTPNSLNYGTEKTWKSLFKFSAIFCFIVIAIVVVKIAAPQLLLKALVKKRYFEKEGYVEILEYNFQKPGCYSIGIASKSEKMKWFHTAGNYQIEFLNPNGGIIETINVEANRLSTNSKSFRSLGMHVFEIPYQGKYTNLKIRYSVITADKTLKAIDDRMYLYLNPTYVMCGKEFEKKENIKKYGIIDYVEKDLKFIPLFTAIKNNDIASVKNIFENQKISLTEKMPGNREPIHYAAYFNSAEILDYLIQKEVELSPVDITGYTPIQYAIANNATDAVFLLLDNGININSIKNIPNLLSGYKEHYQPFNVLFYSATICSSELLNIIVEKGVNIEQKINYSANKKVNILDYLHKTKCRNDSGAKNTILTNRKFKEIQEILLLNGSKKSPIRFDPSHIGVKEK